MNIDSTGKKTIVTLLVIAITVMTLISMTHITSAQTTTVDDTDNQIIISVQVTEEQDPLPNATVELAENGTVIDSGTTDENGYVYLNTTENLTDALIRADHDNYDNTVSYTGIDETVPTDNNTVIISHTLTYEIEDTEEAKDYAMEHPIIVSGAGLILVIGMITVVQYTRDKTGW